MSNILSAIKHGNDYDKWELNDLVELVCNRAEKDCKKCPLKKRGDTIICSIYYRSVNPQAVKKLSTNWLNKQDGLEKAK